MTGRAVLLVGLIGCADSRFGSKGGTGSTDTDPSDTYTTDSGASTPPEISPELQHFDARFELVGGVPQLATSTLTVTLHGGRRDGAVRLRAAARRGRRGVAPGADVARVVARRGGGRGCHRTTVGVATTRPARCGWAWARTTRRWTPPPSRPGYDGATAASAVIRLGPGEPVWLAGLAGNEDQLEGYAPAPHHPAAPRRSAVVGGVDPAPMVTR
jgi:hypothetical protein